MNQELASPALPIPAGPAEAVRRLQEQQGTGRQCKGGGSGGSQKPFSTTHHIPPPQGPCPGTKESWSQRRHHYSQWACSIFLSLKDATPPLAQVCKRCR